MIMKARVWIYHKTKEPILIGFGDLKGYRKKGWDTNPLNIINLKEINIDASNKFEVQQFGEMLYFMTDMCNWIANMEIKTRSELRKYSKKHFGLELNVERKSIMISKINKHFDNINRLQDLEEIVNE